MITYHDALQQLPPEGLFRDASLPFHLSPTPFPLAPDLVRQLHRLGPILLKFQMACDRIYKRSRKGTVTPWIAQTLDAGKPSWLTDEQLHGQHKNALPRVIRPDLLLTDSGFSLTELDSVPGGIGTTTWLQSLYDHSIGAGMLPAFRSLQPAGLDIHISEESADYRPEMDYLSQALNQHYPDGRWTCHSAETPPAPHPTSTETTRQIYRFCELFDWHNVPAISTLYRQQEVTPPLKPHLEEKLWLALLWTPGLGKLWKNRLRSSHLRRLYDIIPHGWGIDSTELPPQASLPYLNVHSWQEVANFSQKERNLVLKISGFNELAWGSRGVHIGHDMPSLEWQEALEHALDHSHQQPWMMQRFHSGKIIEHPYYDPDTGNVMTMKGRVRLCPYFFKDPHGYTQFAGCLATIVPADKKKIHGMRDGILVPCSIAS